jgi:hypothetical protein
VPSVGQPAPYRWAENPLRCDYTFPDNDPYETVILIDHADCAHCVLRARIEEPVARGTVVVIDYTEADRAITAAALGRGGDPDRLLPRLVVVVSDDPTLTWWIVQGLDVPNADAERVLALLVEHGLHKTIGA